jgi:glycosyltransferase involved in cell wall biosynthesis
VVSLHGSDVYVSERHALVGRAARAVFARAARVTACSDDLRTRAIALGASEARIETVPYGVDAHRFAPSPATRERVREALGLSDRPFVFTAGRLVRKKGFDILIAAVARLRTEFPRVLVGIAGEGDLASELRDQAAALGDAVHFFGNQSQDDVAALCAAADVVAVPSVHDAAGNVDGLPNFALEALASATPVVATNVGGLPQAIAHNETGLLVPERDARAMADAIGTLLRHPQHARAIGAAARTSVMQHHGWNRVAERFEAAYGERA